jgi:hypothetical protein
MSIPVAKFRQDLPLGSMAFIWENRGIMSESPNPFSFIRAVLSTWKRCGWQKPHPRLIR